MDNLEPSDNKNMSLNLIATYGDSESDSDERDGDSHGLSIMVLKNNLINACAHGPLSSSQTPATSSERIIKQSKETGVSEPQYREVNDHTSSDSTVSVSESSDSDLDSDVDSVKVVEEVLGSDDEGAKGGKIEAPRVLGELGLDDLPPIEDLAISVPSQETSLIGIVASVVDRIVVVCSYPDTAPVDLDTVLFLDKGAKVLGKVFDVFGQVKQPQYCVRFNSEKHVLERGVYPGLQVYVAPHNTAHTNYVFLSELVKIKGSDASWLNDVEPPPSQLDFSDDEEEHKANRLRKEKKKQSETAATNEEDPNRPQSKQKNIQRPTATNSTPNPANRVRQPFSPGAGPRWLPWLQPPRFNNMSAPRPPNSAPRLPNSAPRLPNFAPRPPNFAPRPPNFAPRPPNFAPRGCPEMPMPYITSPGVGRGRDTQMPSAYAQYSQAVSNFRQNQLIDHFSQNQMNDPNNLNSYFAPNMQPQQYSRMPYPPNGPSNPWT